MPITPDPTPVSPLTGLPVRTGAKTGTKIGIDQVDMRSPSHVQSPFRHTLLPGVNVTDFKRPYIVGGANEYLRAQDQGFGAELGSAALMLFPRVVGGIISSAGHIGDLEAWHAMLTNGESDFTNAVTELGEGIKQGARDLMPIYQEDPNAPWYKQTDTAFWVNTGENLVGSIAEFAALGAGIGGGVSRFAKGLTGLARTGARWDRIAQASGNMLTSAALTFAEGSMEAANTYKTIYEREFERLRYKIGEEEAARVAKDFAAEGAATTAQMNMVNLALNYTAVRSMFRNPGHVKTLNEANLLRQGRESLASQSARLAEQKGPQFSMGKRLGFEAVQESAEEVVNSVAGMYGATTGDVLDTRTKGQKIADSLLNSDTLFAAILGAVGGVGQTALLEGAPIHKVPGEGGQTRRVSAFTLEKERAQLAFDKQRQSIIDHIDGMDTALQAIKAAEENPNDAAVVKAADDAKQTLFKLSTVESITGGGDVALRSYYNDIAKMSPEEAAKEGIDEEAQQRAANKVKQIDKLVKVYDDLNSKLGYTMDEKLAGLPLWGFTLYVGAFTEKERIKELEDQLKGITNEMDSNYESFGTRLSLQELNDAKVGIEAANTAANDLLEKATFIQDNLGDEAFVNALRAEGIPDPAAYAQFLLSRAEDLAKDAAIHESRLNDRRREFTENILQWDENITPEDANRIWNEVLSRNGEIMSQAAPTAMDLRVAEARRDYYEKAYNDLMSSKGRREALAIWEKMKSEKLTALMESYLGQINSATTPEEIERLRDEVYGQISGDQGAAIDQAIDAKTSEIGANAASSTTPNPATPTDTPADPAADADSTDDAPLPPSVNGESDQGKPKLEGQQREQVRERIESATDINDLTDYITIVSKNYTIADDVELLGWIGEATARINNSKNQEGDASSDTESGNQDTSAKNYGTEATTAAIVSDLGSQKDEQGIGPEGKRSRIGDKVVNGGHTVAYLSTEYEVQEDGTILTSRNERVGGAAPLPELGSLLLPGDTIRIEIADDFNGPVYRDGKKVIKTAKQIEEEDGRENVPMRVFYTHPHTGEEVQIGFLHDISWVDAADSAGGPLNVAHMVNGQNNWIEQQRIIREIRKAVAEHGSIETVITGKGRGKLSRNIALDASGRPIRSGNRNQREYDLASVLLPDPNLSFYIVRYGKLQTGPNSSVGALGADKLIEASGSTNGFVGVLLPTPDGKMIAAPVRVNTISEEDAMLMWLAISSFEGRSEGLFTPENSGVILSRKTDEGSLFNLLSKFVQSFSFNHDTLKSEKINMDRVHIHISDAAGHGAVEIAQQGSGTIYTTNKQKSKEEGYAYLLDHKDEVMRLLQMVYYNVDLGRINTGSPIIVPQLLDNGTIEGVEYNNYNEFIKTLILTDLDGRHKATGRDGKEEYSYFQQPTVSFSTQELGVAPKPARAEKPADLMNPQYEVDDILRQAMANVGITLNDQAEQPEEKDNVGEEEEGIPSEPPPAPAPAAETPAPTPTAPPWEAPQTPLVEDEDTEYELDYDIYDNIADFIKGRDTVSVDDIATNFNLSPTESELYLSALGGQGLVSDVSNGGVYTVTKDDGDDFFNSLPGGVGGTDFDGGGSWSRPAQGVPRSSFPVTDPDISDLVDRMSEEGVITISCRWNP